MATNDELELSKLFNVEGLVAVVTGLSFLVYVDFRGWNWHWIEYCSHLTIWLTWFSSVCTK